MTYTLYYSPGAASLAIHWLLIELRAPFEAQLVSIDAGVPMRSKRWHGGESKAGWIDSMQSSPTVELICSAVR